MKSAAIAVSLAALTAATLGIPAVAAEPADTHAHHHATTPATGATISASDAAEAFELKATLSGAAVTKGGDPDGTGSFEAKGVDGKLCYQLSVAGIDPATMAHIHKAPAGKDGGVVLPLATPADGSARVCAEVKPDLLAAILSSPADYYLNVHNAPYPAGAVRGQLTK